MPKKTTGKPAWFPMFPAEFLADEKHSLLTNEELGVYVKLLCRQWMDGSIPGDADALRRLCGCNADALPMVLKCFVHSQQKGRLVNRWLDMERKKVTDKSYQASEAAKDRWNKTKGLDADALRTHDISDADALRTHMQNENENENDKKIIASTSSEQGSTVREPWDAPEDPPGEATHTQDQQKPKAKKRGEGGFQPIGESAPKARASPGNGTNGDLAAYLREVFRDGANGLSEAQVQKLFHLGLRMQQAYEVGSLFDSLMQTPASRPRNPIGWAYKALETKAVGRQN